MMKSFFTLLLLGTAAAIPLCSLTSCETTSTSVGTGSAAVKKESPTKKKPETPKSADTLSPMALGKKLYYGRCTSCHAADPPGKYTMDEWDDMVYHMAARAKLTASEKSALLTFLRANAAPG